jgi:flagellar biosynthesis/type III secretory pathway protein FliH
MNWREFVRRDNPLASALMAKMKIAREDRPRVRLECLRLLASQKLNRARMQLILGFLDTYLRLTADEEREYQEELQDIAPSERNQIMEVTISWKEEGRQEGLQQGLQKGLQQGLQKAQQRLIAMLIQQIERKVAGRLDPQTRELIAQLNDAELDDLAVALLDFRELQDVSAWLARR